ncbi:hypothetical protein RGI86_003406 [Morganella morganii]|nr:hypothetical protein [Morganella morganii]
MQTEPTITSNMSADDVALWITEKAQAITKLATLRCAREKAITDHQRILDRLDEDIAEYEAICVVTVNPQ